MKAVHYCSKIWSESCTGWPVKSEPPSFSYNRIIRIKHGRVSGVFGVTVANSCSELSSVIEFRTLSNIRLNCQVKDFGAESRSASRRPYRLLRRSLLSSNQWCGAIPPKYTESMSICLQMKFGPFPKLHPLHKKNKIGLHSYIPLYSPRMLARQNGCNLTKLKRVMIF